MIYSLTEEIMCLEDDWYEAQQLSCVCHLGHPPCYACIEGKGVAEQEYIELLMAKEPSMNTTNAILSENPDFKIVAVVFDGSNKRYHYKTFFNVEKGNMVVVDSPSNGLVVVEAVDVLHPMEFEGDYQLKWLVSGAIDLEHYEELKTMERKVTKTINQLKYTKQRQEMLANLEETVGEDGIKTIKGLVRL